MTIIKVSPGAHRLLCGCIMLLSGLFFSSISHAQSFDEGLQLYQQGDFRQAAEVFNEVDSPEALLFAGKSYFSLGEYLKAQTYLTEVRNNAGSQNVYLEATYTLALSQFQLKQFGEALEHLHELSQEEIKTQIVTDGARLYKSILDFLTLNQRREAFQAVSDPDIRFDLIRSAFGKTDYATAKILLNEYRNTLADKDTLSPRVQELGELIADSLDYSGKAAFGRRLRAPNGITYNIGAALPRYHPSDANFSIAQGLYNGYLLAAEEFNQRNPNKRAFIKYANTGVDTDSSAYAITSLAWNYRVDAVLGPLFSEPAHKMSGLTELYQIPMLAPLANSDTLNTDNPYLYQANPTFASHGRKMARYAVQQLRMDTIAVLAERNSLGATSAYIFRDEAEKLGAKVPYFFVEDLASMGYEIGEFTKYFTTDSVMVDSMNYHRLDGIYAPFTGQAAPTLIDLTLIDLQGMNSTLPVLGSQEWGTVQIPEDRLANRTIFYTESYYNDEESEQSEQFRSGYMDRFGIEPNQFAMIGYDAASFLLRTLERVENPALLKNALKREPLYEGLISNIHFDGEHINQEVKIFELTTQGAQPVQN